MKKKKDPEPKIIFCSHKGEYLFQIRGGNRKISLKEAKEMNEAFYKLVTGMP